MHDDPGTPVPVRPIELEVEVRGEPAAAWHAVTDPDEIRRWFTEATPLGPVGSAYRLDFGDGSVVSGTVGSVEPGRRFSHTWAWEDSEPGEMTVVTWTVDPRPGGGSIVRLVHDGWEAAGAGVAERDDHEGYWSGYLEDLRDLLEDA